MRRRKLSSLAVTLALAAGTLGLAACVESDDEAADTPAEAPTIENTAIQTDEEGRTIEPEVAPPAAEEPVPEPEAPAAEVEAGQMVFNQTCTACHATDGIGEGPLAPNLQGIGLGADEIEDVVVNGQGAMPGGLVSGQELDEVVAYVESIQ